MKTLHDLKKLAEHYRNMVQHCADVIKNLNGYTPDGFKFAFSIRDALILSIPIGEEEGNFCLGVFMSWHQFYSRKLKELTEEIQMLEWDILSERADQL
jgi:hypothetical protein